LVKQLVEMFYRLYLLQISHGDMKASNIMIVDEKPLLIDLDSMQQHRFGLIAKHQHARDLRRFMRNWQHDEALSNAFKKVFKVVYADHQPLKLAHIH
jgi:tRNA A-37 threonylcarbamoyl transferase component Bud32